MVLCAWLALAPAHAGRVKVVETDIFVVAPREPWEDGSERVWRSYPVRWDKRFRGPDAHSDASVDDGRMQVRCGLKNRLLWLELNPTGPWSARIPESVTCQVGRYDIHATLKRLPPLYDSLSQTDVTPAHTAQWWVRGGIWQTFGASPPFRLPPSGAWVVGKHPTETLRGPWPGETCEVAKRGEHWTVRVSRADPSEQRHEPSAGRCLLPTTDGTVVPVTIEIVRCGGGTFGPGDADCPRP